MVIMRIEYIASIYYNNHCQEGKTKGAPRMKIEIKITATIEKTNKKSPAPKKREPGNSKNTVINITQK